MEIHVIGLPESFKKIKSESEIPTLRLWLLSISSRINFYFARVLSHIRSMWGGVVELYPRVLIFKNLFFWTLRDSSKKKKFWKRRNKKTFTHIMNISSFNSEAFARCMNDFDIDSSAVASLSLLTFAYIDFASIWTWIAPRLLLFHWSAYFTFTGIMQLATCFTVHDFNFRLLLLMELVETTAE